MEGGPARAAMINDGFQLRGRQQAIRHRGFPGHFYRVFPDG